MFWNSTYFHPCFVYFPYFKKHSRWLSYFSSGTGEDRVHCIASLVIFRPSITLVTTSRVVVDFPGKTGFGHQGSSFSVIFFKMGKNRGNNFFYFNFFLPFKTLLGLVPMAEEFTTYMTEGLPWLGHHLFENHAVFHYSFGSSEILSDRSVVNASPLPLSPRNSIMELPYILRRFFSSLPTS